MKAAVATWSRCDLSLSLSFLRCTIQLYLRLYMCPCSAYTFLIEPLLAALLSVQHCAGSRKRAPIAEEHKARYVELIRAARYWRAEGTAERAVIAVPLHGIGLIFGFDILQTSRWLSGVRCTRVKLIWVTLFYLWSTYGWLISFACSEWWRRRQFDRVKEI